MKSRIHALCFALSLAAALTQPVAHAACSAAGFGDRGGGRGGVMGVSSNQATGLDVTQSSNSYNFTLYPGNPSLWANLQSGGFVEFTVNVAAAGTYGLQSYYAATPGASANVLVNGSQQSVVVMPDTGSWGTLATSQMATISLPSGQSTIRLAAQQNLQPFNLAGLILKPLATSSEQSNPPGHGHGVTPVNPRGVTGFDMTSASNASNFSLSGGRNAVWGNLQPNGFAEFTVSAPSAGTYSLQLYYSSPISGGAAVMVDGQQQQTSNMNSTGSWANFTMSNSVTVNLTAGNSTIRVGANNNFTPFNLAGMTLTPTGGQSSSGAYPLNGDRFYVNPYSEAAQNQGQSCSQWYGQNATIQKIAGQPQGVWFGDWNSNVQGDVADVMGRAAQQSAVPVLIAYNIPNRDCNGFSGGGAGGDWQYQQWIQQFAQGINQGKAVVILEPDALLQLTSPGCLNPQQQSDRLSLLNYATYTLHQTAPNASVYIDAGRAGEWAIDPSEMAQRLNYSGIANAAGFALNVSNYIATDVTTQYGNQIAAGVGNKHFVIDTSRNGLGSAGDLNWCNPGGRGLGAPPQGMGGGTIDGYVWAQNPGTSDGSCNGAPPAGQWDSYIACTLANNAVF